MVGEDADDILQAISGRQGSHIANEPRYGILLALSHLSGLCGGGGLPMCGTKMLLAARAAAATQTLDACRTSGHVEVGFVPEDGTGLKLLCHRGKPALKI